MTQKQKEIIKKLIWDYNFTEDEFINILTGQKEIGSFNKKWAVRRAIECLNYYDLIELIDLKTISEVWPSIRETFRIKSIRDGIDYVLRKYNISTSR